MIRFNAPCKMSRRLLLAATAIILFAGTQGSLAGGSDHFGDHSLGNHNFGIRDQAMKPPSESHRDRSDDRNSYFRKLDDRRQDTDRRTAKTRVKDNAGTPATTAPPGTASNNTIHPIITNGAARPAANPPTGTGKDKTPSTNTTSVPPPGIAGNNSVHPIVTNNPAQPGTNAPTGTGKLPPNDPVGNTHPTAGASSPTVVTVSNGVTTTQIQNGLGGVSVYSDKPGTITVSNGKESTTLSGASVTLSGNVVGVGGGQGVEVGPRNGEGKTVVVIKPPSPPPAAPGHVTGGGPEGGFLGDLESSIVDGAKAVGHGAAEGAIAVGKGVYDVTHPTFEARPVNPTPPPATSTIQQQ